jgi:prephenate dehydrogenase
MTATNHQPRTIGIIGGHGQFGGWLAALCRAQGLPVVISDIGTELSNREVARRADVVFVAVPIRVTNDVLEEIEGELSEEKLVADLTSVKTPVLSVLSRLRSAVLSLHPMFAPSLPSVVGQTCIACRVRTGAHTDFVEVLLSDAGMNVVQMDPDEHDRAMAVLQGLTHFQALAAAHCMMRMGFDPNATVSVSSPVYRLRLAMIGRILAQDPRLYAEIQVYNPYIQGVLEHLQESSSLLGGMVRNKDVDGLVSEFREIQGAFGEFTARAMRDSTEIIAHLPKFDVNHS